jgi:hypothetical protein
MNESGHRETLAPFKSGNVAALKHGAFSDRALVEAIEAERTSLLNLPWMTDVDSVLIDEVARLRARIAAVDRDLDERGHFGRNGARSLLEHRARLNNALPRCLAALGATPEARSKRAGRLAKPKLSDLIAEALRDDGRS